MLRRLAASVLLPAAVLSTPMILPHIVTPDFISHENFSTDAAAATAATNQTGRPQDVKVSIAELKSKLFSLLQLKTAPAAPADFPFTIRKYREHDPHFKDNAYMRRDFNGERIITTIFKPKIIKDLSSAAGVCLPQPVSLMVKVLKNRATTSADFGVEICPHHLQAFVIEFKEQSDGQMISHGVHFLEGKGELQSALQEYLKIRGIKPCYAEFMYNYMVWKSKNIPNQVFSNNISAVASDDDDDDDARQTVDRKLREALEHEIDCFDPSAVKIPDAPAGFAFQIEDVAEQMTVKLKQESEAEKIEVEVFPPVYPAAAGGKIPAKVCGGCPNEDRIQLIVNITKEDGEKLEISFWGVVGYGFHPIMFHVNGFILTDEKVLGFDWEEIVRSRGVDASMAEFMMKYMKARSDRNRWITLKKFREFVEE